MLCKTDSENIGKGDMREETKELSSGSGIKVENKCTEEIMENLNVVKDKIIEDGVTTKVSD